MFKEFFRFELQQGRKKVGFWIFFFLLFLLGMLFGMLASGVIGPDNRESNSFVNTAYGITTLMLGTNGSIFGLLNSIIIISLMADGISRDYHNNSHAFFFTKPISKSGYFFGRFFGGYTIAVMVFIGQALGFMLGLQLGARNPQVGPFSVMNYLEPLLLFVLPNVFFQGMIYFSLNTFTRNPMFSYAFAIILLVLRSFADVFRSDIDYKTIAYILDPSGTNAFRNVTEYWTPVEQNGMMIPFSGAIMYNRILWGGVTLAITFLCYFRFSFSQFLSPVTLFKRKLKDDTAGVKYKLSHSIRVLPKVERSFSFSSKMKQILHLARFEFNKASRSIFFFVALALSLLFLLLVPLLTSQNIYGVSTYPITSQMIEMGSALMSIMIRFLALFATGTMLWREKDSKVDELVGSTAVSNSVLFWSKFIGMMMVECTIFAAMIIGSIVYQFTTGFKDINLGQYFFSFFGMKLLEFGVMTLFYIGIQTFFSNKFLGYAIGFLLVIVTPIILELMDYQNPLYFVNSNGAELPHSDLYDWAHYPLIFLIYKIYWLSAGVLLISFAIRFYNRGKEKSLRSRFRLSKHTFNWKAKIAMIASLVVFFISGGFIYYNTSVLNKTHDTDYYDQVALEFEKKYKQYQNIPQPRIISSNVNVDIYPERRGAEINGYMWLKNKTTESLDTIIINEVAEIKVNELSFSKAFSKLEEAKSYGMHIFKLKSPLAVGDSVQLNYKLSYFPNGFKSDDPQTSIIANGTFFNSGVLPSIGYNDGNELGNNKTRKKFGLKEKPRMNKVNDSAAMKNTYIARDADWIDFETVISTSADQIAIAPGYLQKTWEKEGRKYFHYKMDCKILNFYAFLSARYTVVKDKWINPADPANVVNIEIYYNKGHEYNLDRMVKGIKLSLNYYTKNFSPYQHRQVRIIEFPRYADFAQSFPNTIPFSEGLGFVMKIDSESIDMPLYVTAHEVAHQWWAHQVIGADVQGATLMSETMSQYAALMVMEKEYGAAQMKKFLRYEMDKYLKGRVLESRKELPIMYAEDQQYIHYNKGSILMYALKDYIGEDSLNAALRRYIKKVAYQEAPYTTSVEFVNFLKQATPDSLKYIITDMFENITVYNNSIKELSSEKLSSGKYKVKFTVSSIKYRADSLGKQKEIPVNDWIDIGVFAEKDLKGKKSDKELILKKMKVTNKNQVFEFIVDEKPVKVGIDPYNKLVDRSPDNNSCVIGQVPKKDAPDMSGMVIKVGGDDE
jgi:ABC-2 type transport system permease protein